MPRRSDSSRDSDSEDRLDFTEAMRDVTPLRDSERYKKEPSAPPSSSRIKPAKTPSASSFAPPLVTSAVRRDVKNGSFEAALDLHGLTEAQAYEALEAFLREAAGQGMRRVLIITGLGKQGEGALRRLVPLWLEERPFSGYVAACESAPLPLGGDGAYLLRLRRPSR